MALYWLALPGLALWFVILILPWRPWQVAETLEVQADDQNDADLSDITVLIPARNEAGCIAATLTALSRQGRNLKVILINDASTDTTLATAKAQNLPKLTLIDSAALPPGWTGKLWALHQGLQAVRTEKILLLDADIELLPGAVAALQAKMQAEGHQLVSLMAFLSMQSGWEKLLMPAFIYFFKLLYPFRLANSPHPLVAAAAGGCMLLDKQALLEAGGLAAIKGAVIDDCRLARNIKDAGYHSWVGLTHAARSRRPCAGLAAIWSMVIRTAFVQLRFSGGRLALCTVLMCSAFALPLLSLGLSLALSEPAPGALALVTLAMMSFSYLPTLAYYQLHPAWALTLPLAGCLYLGMTWHSAWREWRGTGIAWKDRSYGRQAGRA